MKHITVGRQPILGHDSNICFYEILYQGSAAILSRYSTASVLNSVLSKFGRYELLGDRKAFVNTDAKFLMHDIAFTIPPDFFIFSIQESVELTDRIIERIENLHSKGYQLSIDNLALTHDAIEKYARILDKLAFVKIDIKRSSILNLQELVRKVKSFGVAIVANETNTLRQYEKAKEFGCDYFQGFYFSKPVLVENAQIEPSHLAVLKLYKLLMQDVSIDEITSEFERNHEITVQLLQFINSGAFHFRTKISSIHHVLTLVGRIPLGQWLMLMIYSKSVTHSEKSPLMLMIKNRTELMEGILKKIDPSAGSNALGEAYFTGVLSLIDTVLGVKMDEIMNRIDISNEVKMALLEEEGRFGEIFKLVKDIETFNVEAVALFEKKYKLPIGSISDLVLNGVQTVNEFESATSRDMIQVNNIDIDDLAVYKFTKEFEFRKDNSFVADSPKVVNILLDHDVEVKSMLATREYYQEFSEFLATKEIPKRYVTTKGEMKKIVGHNLHHNCMLHGVRPKDVSLEELGDNVVLLDGITSSENVGSISRSMAAIGVDSYAIPNSSPHPFNRRALRVSMGYAAMLKTHVYSDIFKTIQDFKKRGYKIYAAEVSKDAKVLSSIKAPARWVLVLGHEGHGISQEILDICDVVVKVEMQDGIKSFNVSTAASLIMYQFKTI